MQKIKIYNFLACLLLFISQLHLLRNISTVFLAPYLAGAFALCFFIKFEKKIVPIIRLIAFSYAYCTVVTLFVFLNNQGYGDPLVGFARYFYTVPIIALIFSHGFDRVAALKVLVLFGLLAASSLPYQFMFGQISWFAEVGERAGLVRYSTLLGSLTVFGGVVGPLLILNMYLFDRWYLFQMIGSFLLILSAIISLQKSGVVSVVIAIAILAVYRVVKPARLLLLALIFVLLVLIVNDEITSSVFIFVLNALGSVEEDLKSDDTIIESIFVRLIDWPLKSLSFFGIEMFLFGAGYYGAAGGLGYSDLPMMHNLVGEMIAMYGALGVLLFLCIAGYLIRYFKICVLEKSWSADVACFWACALTFGNSIFSGGLFIHPFTAALFFCTFAVLLAKVR
jgi:hypothetical protein